jgi:Ca2+-binding EF-hand superfamily protein
MSTPNATLLALAAGLACALATPVASAAAAHHSAEFTAMDSNHDGRISSSEHEVYARKTFDLIDANHDDKVTPDELNAQHGVSGHAAGSRWLNAAEKVRNNDTNGDGTISQGEHATAARNKYIHMDHDDNGELTQQELDAGG